MAQLISSHRLDQTWAGGPCVANGTRVTLSLHQLIRKGNLQQKKRFYLVFKLAQ